MEEGCCWQWVSWLWHCQVGSEELSGWRSHHKVRSKCSSTSLSFEVSWKRKQRTAVLANGFGTAVLCWASIWRKPGINFFLGVQLLFHGNVIWRDPAPLQGVCPSTCTIFVHWLALCLCGWAAKGRTGEKRCLPIEAFPSTVEVVCAFWGSLQLSSNSGNPGFVFCRRPEVVLTSIETLG